MATTTLNIVLSEDQMNKLVALGCEAGLSPENLLRISVEEWLDGSHDGFQQAANHVIKKNAELYRRLA